MAVNVAGYSGVVAVKVIAAKLEQFSHSYDTNHLYIWLMIEIQRPHRCCAGYGKYLNILVIYGSHFCRT